MLEKDTIDRLATLCRISLEEGERDALAKDLEQILEYVSDVNDAASRAKEAAPEVPGQPAALREDGEPFENGRFREALLSALPSRDGAYAKVKKILNG